MKLYAVCLAAAAMLFVSGCDIEKDQRTLADLVRHYNEEGLKINEVKITEFRAIGAQEGGRIYAGDEAFEVYKFDLSDEKVRKKFEEISERKTLVLLGRSFPILVNGTFILLNYQKHPRKYDVVRIFETF